MAEIVPFRRPRQWARASDYGAPKRRRGKGGGGEGGKGGGGGGWRKAVREIGPILWAAPLAMGLGVFLATSPEVRDRSLAAAIPLHSGGERTGADRERASFAKCGAFASREACVIDGDTFWYRGEKIRIADINTPETSDPQCPAEAELGQRATARLTALLNAGAFSLERADRTHDRYGRALFTMTRGGESVGGTLVREGLAEEWRGWRRGWC